MQAEVIPRVEGRNFTVKFTVTGIASGFECVLDGMEHIDHRVMVPCRVVFLLCLCHLMASPHASTQ